MATGPGLASTMYCGWCGSVMSWTTKQNECSWLCRFVRANDGTAAVEFALCLPLLLVLLFCGIEIGRLLTDFHVVSKSLRDSGRYLSQVGITYTAPGGPVALSTVIDNASEETVARNLALTGTPDTPTAANYLLPYWTGAGNLTMQVSCIANTAYQGIYEGAGLIPQITIQANVPFAFIWGAVFASAATITMSISHTQTHIGG